MRRLTLKKIAYALCAIATLPLATACSKQYPQFWDLEWDEEVKLHDGRMIIVHVKRTMERIYRSSEFEGSIVREMGISFDAGEPWKRYNKVFKHSQAVTLIENSKNNWYIGIAYSASETSKIDVNLLTPYLILDGENKQVRRAESHKEVPYFPLNNVMPMVGKNEDMVKHFANRLVKWDTKIAYWREHPRAAGDFPDTPAIKRPEQPMPQGAQK